MTRYRCARFCDALKPRRNIHAVAKDVIRLGNYVADIDAHTESNAPVFDIAGCKIVDASLELQGSSNRLNRAQKLRQKSVAGVVDNAAAVLRDSRINNVGQKRS